MEKEPDEERIARLEKRIEELEKRSGKQGAGLPGTETSGANVQVGGIVEGVVGQFIPGLGGIIKALEQSSPEFRRRIADTDAEIRHRIDVGWSKEPVIDYHISTRPLGRGRRPAASRAESVRMPAAGPTREPIVDVLEGKEGITVIAELPGVSEEDLKINLDGESLEIIAGQFCKKISLPSPVKSIAERSYKNGILQLKLERM